MRGESPPPNCFIRTLMARNLKHAFTLIELLVVIAIIAILAAILFPVFAQAKAAAKKSVCLSGTKQDGLAHVMYANDYDDSMMFSSVWWYYSTNNGVQGYTFWWGWVSSADNTVHPEYGVLSPYTKSGAIQDCPAAAGINESFPQSGGAGYKLNAVGVNNKILSTGNGATSYTSISRPAETILFGDAARWDKFSNKFYRTDGLSRPSSWSSSSNYVAGWLHGRHGGLANISWTDGHAKSLSLYYPGVDAADMALTKNAQVGLAIKGSCPMGSSCQNYYYDPTTTETPQ